MLKFTNDPLKGFVRYLARLSAQRDFQDLASKVNPIDEYGRAFPENKTDKTEK